MSDWNLKGNLLAACSCDWGCPCSFDARPTKGMCEGAYLWHITSGNLWGTDVSGLNFIWAAHSPGPLHEGNVTTLFIIDERADPKQREAILRLCAGKDGGPYAIFTAVTGKLLDPVFAPFQVTIDGLNSKARAGSAYEVQLSKIANPVTGALEELQLRKPTGLTSLWADLGKSTVFRVNTPQLKYDHSGLYGEFSEFQYSAAGLS